MKKTRMLGEPSYCLALAAAMASMYGEVLIGVLMILCSIKAAALSTSRSDGRVYEDIITENKEIGVLIWVYTCKSAIAYKQGRERTCARSNEGASVKEVRADAAKFRNSAVTCQQSIEN